jgi:hypothetical protein
MRERIARAIRAMDHDGARVMRHTPPSFVDGDPAAVPGSRRKTRDDAEPFDFATNRVVDV